MKSKFKFKEVSPGWHYNKFAKPDNELEKIDNISHTIENLGYGHRTQYTLDKILINPFEEGGIKRVHIGDTAEKVNSETINERVAHMRSIGYTKEHYFIEFINDKFPDLESVLSDKYNVSHYHCCAIIILPGQCMPVHDDTYSYLKRYMERDFSEVKYDMVKNVRRYMTFLTDWEWGQSIGAGNVVNSQWKVGDVFKWSHKMLHWLSNASMKPIVIFEITGLEL